jgi:hypothetical protein
VKTIEWTNKGTTTERGFNCEKAGVLAVDATRRKVLVRRESAPGKEPEWAQWAVAAPLSVTKGDTVLICGHDAANRFVIGVVSSLAGKQEPVRPIRTGGPDAESSLSMVVHAPDGTLLLEYDEATRRSRIHIGDGGVEIVANGGPVRLSGKSVIIEGREGVRISSDQHVGLAAASGNARGSLEIRPDHSELHSSHLDIAAETALLSLRHVRVAATTCVSKIARLRCVAERIDTCADEIVEKARNVLRKVEGLTQLHTGRWRAVVDSTWFVKSRKTCLKSEKDFKVDGEKIHLG